VPDDALENLLIGCVPDIDLFAMRASRRVSDGVLGRPAEKLKRPIEPAQNVDGRRMHLTMHDDVARARKTIAHMVPAYCRHARANVRF